MRVKDPNGPYMIDPDDAAPDEAGRPRRRASPAAARSTRKASTTTATASSTRTAPGGVDINRNFMHEYPYYQARRRAAHGQRGGDAGAAGLRPGAPQHRGHPDLRRERQPDRRRRRAPARSRRPDRPRRLRRRSTAGARGRVIQTRRQAWRPRRAGFGGGCSSTMQAAPAGRGGRPQARRGPRRTPATAAGDDGATPPTSSTSRASSDKYRELTGIRQPRCDAEPGGAFFEYGYFQFGVPSFSTPGWGLTAVGRPGAARARCASGRRRAAGRQAPAAACPDGLAARRAADSAAGGRGQAATPARCGRERRGPASTCASCSGWTPRRSTASSPGRVQASRRSATSRSAASSPTRSRNPPAAKHRRARRSPRQVRRLPVVALPAGRRRQRRGRPASAAASSGSRRRSRTAGFCPTSLAQGVTARSVKPTMVQLGVEPAAILSGSAEDELPPGARRLGQPAEYEWLIKGKPGAVGHR